MLRRLARPHHGHGPDGEGEEAGVLVAPPVARARGLLALPDGLVIPALLLPLLLLAAPNLVFVKRAGVGRALHFCFYHDGIFRLHSFGWV